MNARRDRLVESITDILKERKIIVDESASRLNDGVIITQPFVFAKGAVTARNELNRYANFGEHPTFGICKLCAILKAFVV
jgi:hypothetical protein